eukprot:PITA_14059
MAPGPGSDRFSKLSDDLLCLILTRLPIKEAVRSSVLSKRWRYLYSQIPQLTISPYFVMGSVSPTPLSIATVEIIISNFLLSHSSDLQGLYLFPGSLQPWFPNGWKFTCQSVWKWVECAARKNVQHLALCHSYRERVILLPALFSCTNLRTLRLCNYIVSNIPQNFCGFNHLIACDLFNMEFRNDSFTRFISHCPLLEKLQISKCSGLQNLIISAPNITVIRICNRFRNFNAPVELLTIRCPKLRCLEVLISKDFPMKDLRVNGLLFQELSFAVQRLDMQFGSDMVGVSLLSTGGKEHNLSAERFLEIIGSFKSLKMLSVTWFTSRHFVARRTFERQNLLQNPLLNLLQTLPHLQRLALSGLNNFILELGIDPIPPCLNSVPVNIRFICVSISGFNDKETTVLGWFLENSPLLETMEIQIPPFKFRNQERCIQFLAKVLDLRRASPRARVRVTEIKEEHFIPFEQVELH